jgi:hypothetical protein
MVIARGEAVVVSADGQTGRFYDRKTGENAVTLNRR